MASRHFRVLNTEGQRLIDEAFRQRTRHRGAYQDVADAYIRALRDHGLLERYLIPGVDPFDVLKTEAARQIGE